MRVIQCFTLCNMFIKSDYKDLYFKHLRHSGYSPASIRILKSDTLSLFTWLHALEYSVPIDEVVTRYEKFLILNGSSLHTITRRLSSTNKFIHWCYSEFNTPFTISPTVHTNVLPDKTTRPRNISTNNKFLYVSTIIILIGIFSCAYIIYLSFSSQIPYFSKKEYPPPAIPSHSLHFNLQISSPSRVIASSTDNLMFKIYSQDDSFHAIGIVKCSLSGTTIPKGSSRLQIDVLSNCSSISDEIRDKMDRSDAIYADIYLNAQKLTESKVLVENNNSSKSDSNYQHASQDSIANPSRNAVQLPNLPAPGDVLGLEIANKGFSPHTIPLSLVQNSTSFKDGDIVAIYDNTLVRALLSTKVLGVVSGNSVVTEGIAYVHMKQSPDTMISSGDYISTSVQPGYGQRANSEYDSVIGIALEPLMPGNEYLKVLISLP